MLLFGGASLASPRRRDADDDYHRFRILSEGPPFVTGHRSCSAASRSVPPWAASSHRSCFPCSDGARSWSAAALRRFFLCRCSPTASPVRQLFGDGLFAGTLILWVASVILISLTNTTPVLMTCTVFAAGLCVSGGQVGANALSAASYPTPYDRRQLGKRHRPQRIDRRFPSRRNLPRARLAANHPTRSSRSPPSFLPSRWRHWGWSAGGNCESRSNERRP